MRTALTVLIAIHGLIHVLGVMKWWKLASIPQLAAPTTTLLSIQPGTLSGWFFGSFWLTALIALSAAAVLRVTDHELWSSVALAGVVLSQVLIVSAWRDAKFGTIANVIILVPALAAVAHGRFVQRIDREVSDLFARDARVANTTVVRAEEVRDLPLPVRRWLDTSGIVGRERASAVRLKQRGELRQAPGAEWLQIEAEQYFTVSDPGFIWKAETNMMKVVPVTARDRLVGGEGEMLVKAGSLIDVANASDDRIALGAMLRYLGETIWFPSAALSPAITWDPIDDRNAKATLRIGARTVSADMSFDEQGNATGMRADRWYGGGKDAKLLPWFVTCNAWQVIRGVKIPVRGEVSWELRDHSQFSYYRWEILDVEVNRPELFPAPPVTKRATDLRANLAPQTHHP